MGELLDFVRDSGFNALRILVNHHFVLVNRQLNAGGFDEGLNFGARVNLGTSRCAST